MEELAYHKLPKLFKIVNIMKKFSILFALVMAISAMAQTPTFNRIRINLQNTNTTRSDYAYLIESPDFTADFENGYDVIKGTLGGDIFVYSITTDGRQSDYFNNTLENLPIGFWNKTDNAATMKFTFSEIQHGLEGDFTYYLKDNSNDSLTIINQFTEYVFTAAANEQNDTRFMIVKPEFKVCTTFDHVEIYGNVGSDNIVITNAAGETVVDVAPVPVYQAIDLSGKPAGHYFLTVNGTQYEFFNKPEAK